MHYYCNCKQCRERKADLSGYMPEDENLAPRRKAGRGKKFCKKASPKTPHDFSKAVEVYRNKYVYDFEKKNFKYEKMLVTEKVCSRCGKPQTRYFY